MTAAEIFASGYLTSIVLRALVVGVLVSLCSAMLGVSLVLRGNSMIGDGLSHVGFFALAVAAVAGVGGTFSMEISIPIVIAAAVLILRLSGKSGISGDAACAVVSTGAVAVGTIMYNVTGGKSGDICSSLFGSSSAVTISNKDMLISVALSAVVIVWFVLFAKHVFAVTFDETFTRAAGVRTDVLTLALAVLTGVTIVVGMKMMGSIMISALIVFPALSAMRLTKSYRLTVILSCIISVVCFTAGFLASCFFSLQTGAAVVTEELVFFLLACVWEKVRVQVRKKSGDVK